MKRFFCRMRGHSKWVCCFGNGAAQIELVCPDCKERIVVATPSGFVVRTTDEEWDIMIEARGEDR